MNSIKSPTIYNCAEELFNSLYFICENTVYLNEVVSPKLIYILNELSPFKLKFIYFKENLACPICGSKLNKNGIKKYNLNKNQYYKQQYSCSSSKCNYTTTASIEQHIEKNCNYTKEIREKRLELFDIDFIEIFLKYSLENQTRKILITDGHTAYPDIIKKLNMKQQKCVFHKIQNQRTPVWKKIHRLERKNKSKQNQINKNQEKINTINKKYGKIKWKPKLTEKTRRKNLQKRKKLQREIQKLKNEIKHNKNEIKRYENYNKRISNLFKSKTLK